MNKTLLVLCAHTDDGEFGAGATISKKLREGFDVHFAVFSKCVKSLPEGSDENRLLREWDASMKIYGIKKENQHFFDFPVRELDLHRQKILEHIINLRSALSPNLVFAPSSSDVHQDHAVISQEALRAFKSQATILGYEFPWNMTQSNLQHLEAVSKEDIDTKMNSILAYNSQQDKQRIYAKREVVEGLARVRGAQCNSEFAEAFEVIRSISPL